MLDRLLDLPPLLRLATRWGVSVDPAQLGAMTVSMLHGPDGFQRKEIEKLVRYLADQMKPDIVTLPNSLLIGLVPAIKAGLPDVPVCCTFQGEELFLDSPGRALPGQGARTHPPSRRAGGRVHRGEPVRRGSDGRLPGHGPEPHPALCRWASISTVTRSGPPPIPSRSPSATWAASRRKRACTSCARRIAACCRAARPSRRAASGRPATWARSTAPTWRASSSGWRAGGSRRSSGITANWTGGPSSPTSAN